jgi:acetylornithine deacetylase
LDALALAEQLIQQDSVTGKSNCGCAELLAELLRQRRFEVQLQSYRDVYGNEKLTVAACRPGTSPELPGLAFFSHSDVVSIDGWKTVSGSGPFQPTVSEGRLWGRGACDMKGPIASALAAIDRINIQEQKRPIYFFITGDEECGMVGAELLNQGNQLFLQMVQSQSAGIITEPTQLRVVNQHKGGCVFTVTAHGIAAHSSTGEGLNANWQLIPWLSYLRSQLQRIEADPLLCNAAFRPASLSMNIVLQNQPAAYNITVGRASCTVFLRTMPHTQWRELVEEMTRTAREMELEVSAISALNPLHTPADRPIVTTALDVLKQFGPDAISYATDGCRYSRIPDLIVLGPGNIAQAHRCDEWIELEQLERGTEVYREMLERLVVSPDNQPGMD